MNYDYSKLIGTNLDESIRKTRRVRNFAIAGLPMGFIMFGGGMPLTLITELYFLAFIPVLGFLLFPTSIFLLAMSLNKLTYLTNIKNTVNTVKSQDKVFVFQLAGYNPAVELQYVTMLQKLIEVGALEGYTMIGNLAVAKTSLALSESSVREEYLLLRFGQRLRNDDEPDFAAPGSLADYAAKAYGTVNSDTKECYFCHTKVPADAMYCTKCGARLDK